MLNYPVIWSRRGLAASLLLPLSCMFGALVALRRWLYRNGWLRSEHLPVPVIVVGNISVGGTGKTPLTLWLAQQLKSAGYTPGIVSRGYGGTAPGANGVHADSDPRSVGDEPVLLARASGCPVWIGKNRAEAACALLAANPDCNIILCDDGLQHYRLARDVEIAVVDGLRGSGNGYLLPAGPLREPLSRLATVDAVVTRGGGSDATFSMSLEPAGFTNVHDKRQVVNAGFFSGKRVHAVAGIGNPQQFFDTLSRMGIPHTPHVFADHHPFRAEDLLLAHCDAVVMTEKDAVKCETFAPENCWALRVEARVDNALYTQIAECLHRLR